MTKYTLETVPNRTIWVEGLVYDESQFDALINASVAYGAASENDVDASITIDFSSSTCTIIFIYGQPVERPPVYSAYYDIPALETALPSMNSTWIGFNELLSSFSQPQTRYNIYFLASLINFYPVFLFIISLCVFYLLKVLFITNICTNITSTGFKSRLSPSHGTRQCYRKPLLISKPRLRRRQARSTRPCPSSTRLCPHSLPSSPSHLVVLPLLTSLLCRRIVSFIPCFSLIRLFLIQKKREGALTKSIYTGLNVVIQWLDPSNDAGAVSALESFTARIQDSAKQHDVLLGYEFMNDAGFFQNTLASYGTESLATLKATARAYDVFDVFQRLQNNGFLLSKT